MRHILLSLLLLASAALSAEDATPSPTKMPGDAQQLIDREAAQEQTLQAELDAKVARLKHELALHLKPCEDRAIHAGNLDGAEAVKAVIAKLQGEKPALQPEQLDSLTAAQWNQLEAPIVSVNAMEQEHDTHVTLQAGEKAYIVPSPTDQWTASASVPVHSWRGERGTVGCPGSLMVRVNGVLQGVDPSQPVVGPGRIFLEINDSGDRSDNSGTMRVKIIHGF